MNMSPADRQKSLQCNGGNEVGLVCEGDVPHRENEVKVQSFRIIQIQDSVTHKALPCVEVLDCFVSIHYSPDLDKGLLYHEIEDAEQIHDGEDGKEEEEGG